MNSSVVEDTAAYARMARVITWLEQHYLSRPSLADLARVAGLSPSHFSREFRRWAGLSPTQYLRTLSLAAAKQKLEGRGSVLTAAWSAGLSGGGRLHDLFISFEAVTPGEYKAAGAGLELRHGFAGTPFGLAHLAMSRRGLARLIFVEDGKRQAVAALQALWPKAVLVQDDAAAAALADRIFVKRKGRVALQLQGTNFQVQVWKALLKLGQRGPTSYSALAQAIGQPAASRAVGSAVGANPVAWLIPCHRVIRKDGGLGGYRWGPDRKRAMLAWEQSQSAAMG